MLIKLVPRNGNDNYAGNHEKTETDDDNGNYDPTGNGDYTGNHDQRETAD